MASTSALEMAEEDETIMAVMQILARVMSLLSVIGSSYILFSLLGNKARRVKSLKSAFNRLLAALCVSDVVASVAMSIGNWAVPTSPACQFQGDNSQEIWDIYFPGATGNDHTCTSQGFFVQLGSLGSALFTCFITLQTVLIVVFKRREASMKRVEIAFFVVGILAPVATATYGAMTGLMSPTISGYCWISNSAFPKYINETYTPNENNCGAELLGADLPRMIKILRTSFLLLGWINFVLVIVAVSMIILFCFVRIQERQASRWSQNAQQGRRQKRVLAKALPYIFMYPLIWFPTVRSTFSSNRSPIGLHMFSALLLPLQGFLNSLIYAGIVDKCLRKCCCCCTCCFRAPGDTSSMFVSGTSHIPARSNTNQSMSFSLENLSGEVDVESHMESADYKKEHNEGNPNTDACPNNGAFPVNARNITGANTPTTTKSGRQVDD